MVHLHICTASSYRTVLAMTQEQRTKSNNVEMCCRCLYKLIDIIKHPSQYSGAYFDYER